ncbi:MAG: rod shape-determining protein MreD [Rhodobacteraceae bacterium]|nr:rod shape-determining protein MreD [Paracoccaceae bacterium]QEW18865.1 hypothetical protein LA6_001041 [Marinibacterium anthonyi]
MPSRTWPMRVAYVILAMVIIFFHLLPLETVPRHWAPPDMLLVFTFAWILRRPDYAPTLLIAGVFLLADLLLERPPGLYAALVVLGSDFLKSRANGLSETSFLGEWTTVAIVLSAVMVIYRVILGTVVLYDVPLSLAGSRLILTIAAYPLAVVISQSVLGVRRPTPADSNAMGARS